MSGIEIHLLQVAFDTFKEKTICEEAEFVINRQRLKLQCLECHEIFEADDVQYDCISCKSTHIKVLDGEEMYLMQLEMG